MKQKALAVVFTLLAALALTGCNVSDTLLYLYGGDEWSDSDTPSYATYLAGNGLTVVYDQNVWPGPNMVQEDTLGLTAGNQLTQTTVLLQVTDDYEDFLTQSGAELAENANNVEYELTFTVPDAAVQAVRYDCGSYQALFAQIDYDSGLTAYMTAATKSGDYQPIIDLLQNVWPTGHTPETARELAAQAPLAESGAGEE